MPNGPQSGGRKWLGMETGEQRDNLVPRCNRLPGKVLAESLGALSTHFTKDQLPLRMGMHQGASGSGSGLSTDRCHPTILAHK